MPNQTTKRDRALDAIEESIKRTLQAQNDYLAAWNVHWKQRVAMNFASLSDDPDEELTHGSIEVDTRPVLET